jgi:hypothetical protein
LAWSAQAFVCRIIAVSGKIGRNDNASDAQGLTADRIEFLPQGSFQAGFFLYYCAN